MHSRSYFVSHLFWLSKAGPPKRMYPSSTFELLEVFSSPPEYWSSSVAKSGGEAQSEHSVLLIVSELNYANFDYSAVFGLE